MAKKKSQAKKIDDKKINFNTRTRVFAFLVYPDSAPENWIDILSETHVEALISPLHDEDMNPDGTKKKAHWHVLIMFSSVKTYAQAQEIRDLVNGVGWENVASKRGYARYLCHLDNPEKAQYATDGVKELSGADYREIIKRDADEKATMKAILRFVAENGVVDFCDIVDYAAENNDDWFDLLMCSRSFGMNAYLTSFRKKLMNMTNESARYMRESAWRASEDDENESGC